MHNKNGLQTRSTNGDGFNVALVLDVYEHHWRPSTVPPGIHHSTMQNKFAYGPQPPRKMPDVGETWRKMQPKIIGSAFNVKPTGPYTTSTDRVERK